MVESEADTDFALAQELKRHFKNSNKPPEEDLFKISEDLGEALRLEEGMGKTTTPEVRQGIIDEIANTIYFASDFYKLRPSEFGLTHNWGEKPPKDHVVSADGKSFIIATADMNGDFPHGLISFAPVYMTALGDLMMGRKSESAIWVINYPVSYVGGHEVDHLDKFLWARREMQRDLRVFATEGMDGWVNTPTERAARLFGKLFQEVSAQYIKSGVIFDQNAKVLKRN